MESTVPSKKSDKEFVEINDRVRKRKAIETSTIQGVVNNTESPPAAISGTPIAQEGQESQLTSTIVLPEQAPLKPEPSATEKKIDIAMRNQISSSRATTVELDALKDLMPKLRKEINTYSINECQLIKELEKKLPSCYEHKDVRLNIVLEEIQRLRLNRRRALAKLKEATVKIVELQSKMELTSYEAGEIFWNGKISKMSDEKYSKLEEFTESIQEKESSVNFSLTPAALGMRNESRSMSADTTVSSAHHNIYSQMNGDRGSFAELSSSVATSRDLAELLSEGIKKQGGSMHPRIVDETSSRNIQTLKSSELSTLPNNNNVDVGPSFIQAESVQSSGSQGNDTEIDFGKMLAEAQKQAEWRRKITKKGIMIAVIPPAAVIGGIILLDWLTGIFSTTLGALFGG